MDERELPTVLAEVPDHLAPRPLGQPHLGLDQTVNHQFRYQLTSLNSLVQVRLVEQPPNLIRLSTASRRVLLLSTQYRLIPGGL